MHRKGIGIILALALLAISAIPAAAGARDGGPSCGDILALGDKGSSLGTRVTYDASGVIGTQLELDAPSCEKYTYTFYVLDEVGGTSIELSTSRLGNGADHLALNIAYDSPDNTVCVYATSSFINKSGEKVLDRAPDSGCVTLVEGQSFAPAGGNRMG